MTLEQVVSQVLQELLTNEDELAFKVQEKIHLLADDDGFNIRDPKYDRELDRATRFVLSTLRKI